MDDAEYICERLNFPHCQIVIRVDREVRSANVENCLHFIKDRWWDEDRHYTKRPGLAEVFASLTNAALSVLRLIHIAEQPLRATAERTQWRPHTLLHRLGFGRAG